MCLIKINVGFEELTPIKTARLSLPGFYNNVNACSFRLGLIKLVQWTLENLEVSANHRHIKGKNKKSDGK